MYGLLLMVAAGIVLAGSAAATEPRPVETPELAGLDKAVLKALGEQRYPGAVLLVGQGDKVRWFKAYGRFTYAPDSPEMKLDTMFDLASCTKICGTTPAALLALEDGKLALDDRVMKYVPGFEANGKGEITLKDLMTHVSGLKAYETWSVVEKQRKPDETHAQALIRRYAELPLVYTPRTKMLYSCLNMQTMAHVLQVAEGTSTEDLLRKRIWKPLGMVDTTYRPSQAQRYRCAPIGVRPDGSMIQGEVHDPLAHYHGAKPECPGNAGLFSTASDLSRYAQLVLNGGSYGRRRILKPETVALMTSVQTPTAVSTPRSVGWGVYGPGAYATAINQEDGSRIVGHTGYTGTWMWLDTRSKAYIILLTNRVFPSPATNGGEGKAIDPVRAAIAKLVLRSLPEYQAEFARKPAVAK